MKKYKIAITLTLLFALCVNVFGQNKLYPFEVQKTGNGKQAVIFIPGFACSGEVWKETKSHFEQDYVCYRLTMAGFAGAKPQENATFESWEKAIVQYIQDNKIEKPIIIGHSMGGGLALAIASDYPNLPSKIVVVDALPCLLAMTDPAFKSKENNDCSPIVKQLMGMTDKQFYEMQKNTMPRLLSNTAMLETVVNWSVKSDRKTFAEMYCDFSNTDLREKIKNIKCPSLILLESYFKNFKPAVEDQYKNLKGGELQYADKGLHFIMYDDKEWFFSQLNNFLAKK
jgi:pimeloyl-ACP methyl ester carboxylesterase